MRVDVWHGLCEPYNEYLLVFVLKNFIDNDENHSVPHPPAPENRSPSYFLSIYAHVGRLESDYHLLRRHDQAIALWQLDGTSLSLQRYWELERLTGQKGHGRSFANSDDARQFIACLLAEEGLTFNDIDSVIGTPDIAPSKQLQPHKTIAPDINYHSLCHLYSGLFVDSTVFYQEKILCLALDAGPDYVLDPDIWHKPHYWAAYAEYGTIHYFAVPSPAIYWALLRERLQLAEGTLMALGSATTCQLAVDIPDCPRVISLNERYQADAWLEQLISIVEALTEQDEGGAFHRFDRRFSFRDNQISMIVKVVHQQSLTMVQAVIEQALQRYHLSAESVYLSITGGFALNCPTNSLLMRQFNFKGFIAPPAVNDSGIALGMGLHYAHQCCPSVQFSLTHAAHGRQPQWNTAVEAKYAPLIQQITQWNVEQAVDDLINGPVVWFDGSAEIGPRALGHRSLLADPRNPAAKIRLNQIKQREWWRPVAPIVEHWRAHEWFDLKGDSPYMLQAVPVHPDKQPMIPAVCHLDGSARVQTLTEHTQPRLYQLLQAFYRQTRVPILCNTSLNDKGEPIIDSIERALLFAMEKQIAVVYLHGQRLLINQGIGHEALPRYDYPLRQYIPPAQPFTGVHPDNPHQLSKDELEFYFSDPRLLRYDLTSATDVLVIRRLFKQALHRHGASAKRMLWQADKHNPICH